MMHTSATVPGNQSRLIESGHWMQVVVRRLTGIWVSVAGDIRVAYLKNRQSDSVRISGKRFISLSNEWVATYGVPSPDRYIGFGELR